MRGDGDTQPLHMQLQNRNATKEIGTEQQARRPPCREHDESECNPAAARGHVLRPHGRVGERHIGPGQPAAHAAEQDGGKADSHHAIADGMGRIMGIADGPQDQPCMGAIEEPGDPRDQREGGIDQEILVEQNRPDDGKAGENRQVQLRQRVERHADIGFADQRAEAGAEDGKRQAGRHLVGQQDLGQDGEGKGKCSTGKRRGSDTQDRTAGGHGNGKADHCTHQHHPLDAEIEHTGFLGDQFAGCGQQQRRGSADDREDDRHDPGEAHAAGLASAARRPKRRR